MTTTFTQAIQSYLSAKSLLSESKDLDRILYARNEVKKALHELTRFRDLETDPLRLELIESILKN